MPNILPSEQFKLCQSLKTSPEKVSSTAYKRVPFNPFASVAAAIAQLPLPPAMDAASSQAAGAGGPAPFLLKTYDMVDDTATDDIVSWSPTNASFIVWNPPDFAARLLPTYFKHNNFSSFIRQLNTYGFRKSDPERWEFTNEEFIKGHKHLLKNIHRRKPIHSHSATNPPASGGLPDAERAALADEIERLSREKAALQADLLRFKQQQSGTRIQLDDLERRLLDMEQRQLKMVAFLQRAIHSPKFVDALLRMAGAEEFSAASLHRKRRLPPGLDFCPEVSEDGFYDNHSSASRVDVGQVFNRDFCDKLTLELCPAISGTNLVSPSTQSSNEDVGSAHVKQSERIECLAILPESLELSDTGASLCSRKNFLFPQTPDDGDGLVPYHLNLTLASCPMQVGREYPDRTPNLLDQGEGESVELRAVNGTTEDVLGRVLEKSQNVAVDLGAANAQPLPESREAGNQAPAAPSGRVNDVFWEQFLTERPGSSDTEEASSSLRAHPTEEQPEEKKQGNDNAWRNRKAMEQLTL